LVATQHNSAWDGRNLVPGQNGAWVDKDLQNLFPQLDNYLAALSIATFGDSTWMARLPFALCGLGSLILFWRILSLEFPANNILKLYAQASAALSVPLLLYFRNCRYYGLSVFLTMGILLCYRRFLKNRHVLDAAAIGVLAGLLSLNSILNCACLMGGLFARHLIFHRRILSRQDWLKAAVALLLGGALVLPYAWESVVPFMTRSREYAHAVNAPANPSFPRFFAEMVWRNLVGISSANAVPWSIGVCLLVFLLWKGSKAIETQAVRKGALELLATIAGFIVVLSILTPQNATTSSIADLRYFTPMLPLMAALVGVVFWWIHQCSPLVSITLLLVYLGTDLLALNPLTPRVRWLLPDFCKEIVNPYPTSCSETCAYLRANSQQDDTVWLFPDYMGKPLMYYLGDKLKFRGILDRTTLLPKEAVAKLDREMFIENVFPNWVVSFGRNPEVSSTVAGFSRPLPGTNTAYRYTRVKVIDVYFDQIQRPELPFHSFGPWRGFDKSSGSVYIFKRSETPLLIPIR